MATKKAPSKKERDSFELVRMERPDGRKADVHPDEVEEYEKGGYVRSGKTGK